MTQTVASCVLVLDPFDATIAQAGSFDFLNGFFSARMWSFLMNAPLSFFNCSFLCERQFLQQFCCEECPCFLRGICLKFLQSPCCFSFTMMLNPSLLPSLPHFFSSTLLPKPCNVEVLSFGHFLCGLFFCVFSLFRSMNVTVLVGHLKSLRQEFQC